MSGRKYFASVSAESGEPTDSTTWDRGGIGVIFDDHHAALRRRSPGKVVRRREDAVGTRDGLRNASHELSALCDLIPQAFEGSKKILRSDLSSAITAILHPSTVRARDREVRPSVSVNNSPDTDVTRRARRSLSEIGLV